MILSLPERYALLEIMPIEDNFATLRMAWRLKLVLAPTEEEIKDFDIKEGAGRIEWDGEKVGSYATDVPISDEQTVLIQQLLNKLDKNKKLNPNTMPLYDKFVLSYNQQ